LKPLFHLPQKAQEEVLEIVEEIEELYHLSDDSARSTISSSFHPLRVVANLATDVGITDFAERHDLYANSNLED